MPKDEAQLYAAIELVVNGALEYLANDLGIAEQRISLDGNSVSQQSVIKFGELFKFWKNAKASSLNSITQHNAGIKRGWIQHNAGCMHPSVCVASWMNLVNEFVAGTAVNILVMPKDAFEQGKDLDEFFQSTSGFAFLLCFSPIGRGPQGRAPIKFSVAMELGRGSSHSAETAF